MRRLGPQLALLVVIVALARLGGAGASSSGHRTAASGIHKITHIVIIMQENRSFDSYFGTYPGAAGIPGIAGNPGKLPCVPDPQARGCVKPYHDSRDINSGGPHFASSAKADINGGKMNGFVRAPMLLPTIPAKKLRPWPFPGVHN
jgi:phospholipase C